MENWFVARGHTLSCTRLHAGEKLPAGPDGFDWLVVMGGPMNIYQYRDYPWLREESLLIAAAITARRRVLGICLGAQLIANVQGGKVYQNREREIGWFPVRSVPQGARSPFAFPVETVALHWHGDTFSLPIGADLLAESAGCTHQAFAIGSRTVGLQFHLEMTDAGLGEIARACAGELTGGRYVQTAERILALVPEHAPASAALLDRLLGLLERG